MSTMLADLIQHLQDVQTLHPGHHSPVVVAVPTTHHTLEQFEVGEIHQDGPSVVLYCHPVQQEPEEPQDEPDSPRAEKTETCVHNDYEDLL